MKLHQGNFKAWYADVLEGLHADQRGGIAAFMITLPLLERYLRLKSGLKPKDRVDKPEFWENLRMMFPALPDAQAAKDFWSVFRHGFLHQATLSLETHGADELPGARLTHMVPDPLIVGADGSFTVNPVSFSRAVVSAVEQDFRTFVGDESKAPPLEKVGEQPYPAPAADGASGSPRLTIVSTSSRP